MVLRDRRDPAFPGTCRREASRSCAMGAAALTRAVGFTMMVTSCRLHRLLATLIPGLLAHAAIAQTFPAAEEPPAPPLPEASYAAAARSGATVYRILPQESVILVRVGRAGFLKRLGHDHVVASEDVQGLVAFGDDPSVARADLAVPLGKLIVDKPEYRERLGYDTQPSAANVAGTYTNMLNVLEQGLYPWVEVNARIASPDAVRPMLNVAITLHGTTFEYRLAVDLEIDDKRLVVSGCATIRHSDFGLKPFAAAAGLLRVADEIEIEFRLVGDAEVGP